MPIIDEIIELEWNMFTNVKNEGGRADCQDNRPTFVIMRKSQFQTWNDELLESYLTDVKSAKDNGRNLVSEKYARMMANTAPDEYERIKGLLPALSPARIEKQEEIIRKQVKWSEEFAMTHPKLMNNGRSIHSEDDTPYSTSSETYLRGELGTYSDETLEKYYAFVTAKEQNNQNLVAEIMDNTVKLYGYASSDDAEKKIN